jgi:hypothetical protein
VGKITLQVNTRGYQGKTTKSASVSSNDPNQRNARIYLSINVRPHIIVEPAPRILLTGVVGEDLRRVVLIRSADDQPLEITGVETNLGSVIDYTLNRKEDGRRYELEVAVKSTGTQVSSGFLELSTNHPVKKALKLPVLVRVNPELEVRPAAITFRKRSIAGSKERQFKRVLTVVNNRGKPFQVRGLRYNEEYFQVRPQGATDKPSSNHRFEVVPLLERLPAGRTGLQDTLVIETDVAQAAELRVPMKIQVDPAQVK